MESGVLSPLQLNSCVGQGWHLTCAGFILMWVLSAFELRADVEQLEAPLGETYLDDSESAYEDPTPEQENKQPRFGML